MVRVGAGRLLNLVCVAELFTRFWEHRIGMYVANCGVMLMCEMNVSLVRYACAIWYGQVMVSHSTR